MAMLALYGWGLDPDHGGDAPARLLERLVEGGLPFAAGGDGTRLFDPAEAINRVIASGLAGEEPAWEAGFVATGRGLARSLDPATPDAGPLGPRRFRVAFERNFDLRPLAGRASARLRLPRPIADHALGDLAIETAASAGIVAHAPGRIEVRLAGPLPPELTVAFAARFASRPDAGDPMPLSPADRARWLTPGEGFVQVTPMVRALADRLAEGLAEDRAVMAFRDHLLDRFACGIVAYEAIAGPATDHVLASGWYDCQIGAALLVALCRARNIPARLVGGYLLWPAAPNRHVWCEIRLESEGWRPFDLLAWDLSAGGRDPVWRGAYAGRIDHRMKTEILPDIFAGPMSLPFPAAHHRLVARRGDGIEIDHRTLDDAPIHRDRISVVVDAA